MTARNRYLALGVSAAIALTGAAACNSKSSSQNTASGSSTSSTPAPSASPSPVADLTSLSGVHTQVMLDKSFLAALNTLKLTPGLIGTAQLSKSGTLTFPITSGTATYYKPGTVSPYVQGMIHHDGSGLTLSAGGTKVGLSNFVVDPGSSMLMGKVTANGATVLPSAPLFFLNGSTLQPLQVDKASNTAVLYGTKVYLTAPAAALLNKTFKTNALSDKTYLGIAKITLKLS